MRILKVLSVILVAMLGVFAIAINIASYIVGGGSLGSSVQEKAYLNRANEKNIAHEIYKESCEDHSLSVNDFAKGLPLDRVDNCNNRPNPSGIKFIGGNGNEMYLLSHDQWDVRTLYATYYLLRRGFTGPDQDSLKMDCSPPGFVPRPKMTLGVHYGLKDGQEISFITSIKNPAPNRDKQYISEGYSPEGSGNYNDRNAISPHAFGQALDVYTYGCTNLTVRLDSDYETASRWACGRTGTVLNHSYFYPIKNIPIEFKFLGDDFSSFSSSPDTGAHKPDAFPQSPYLLDPTPGLTGCSSGPVTIAVQSNCNPPVFSATYNNAGCIAQNSPQNYISSYIYRSPGIPGFLTSGRIPRIQPFQFNLAIPIPNAEDPCACEPGAPIDNSVPEVGTTNYLGKALPIVVTDPDLTLAVPPQQDKLLNDSEVRDYLKSQAEKSRKIVLEASMLFSIRDNTPEYQQAQSLFESLIGSVNLPIKPIQINQIVSPNIGDFQFSDSYNDFARLIYGFTNNGNRYDASLINGHKPGLLYNSTDKDRLHLGF